jgi:hypothetical protein
MAAYRKHGLFRAEPENPGMGMTFAFVTNVLRKLSGWIGERRLSTATKPRFQHGAANLAEQIACFSHGTNVFHKTTRPGWALMPEAANFTIGRLCILMQ